MEDENEGYGLDVLVREPRRKFYMDLRLEKSGGGELGCRVSGRGRDLLTSWTDRRDVGGQGRTPDKNFES